MPADSDWRGMSSTLSIMVMRYSRRLGRTGANPTPQLPMTTVDTPCHNDGVTQRVPDGLAVVMGMDIDPAWGH
jgi:hypothetical protein